MPRGRVVSKGVSTNDQLAGVSIPAALLFTWCIPHLDREGRFHGSPALIKSLVFPLRKDIQEEHVPALLYELGDAGLIRWYEVQNRRYVEFPGFKNHHPASQLEREAPSDFPPSTSKNAQDLLMSSARPTLARLDLIGLDVTGTASAEADAVGRARQLGPKAEELRDWLGEHDGGVVEALSAELDGDGWAMAVMGWYGPNGTRPEVYGDCDAKDRPRLLASALLATLTKDRTDIHQGFLASAIRSAAREPVSKWKDNDDRVAHVADARRESSDEAREREAREEAAAKEAHAKAKTWYDALPPDERKAVAEAAKERATAMAAAFGGRMTEPMKRAAFTAECQEWMNPNPKRALGNVA